jgi:hypothetical protein
MENEIINYLPEKLKTKLLIESSTLMMQGS